MPTHSLKLPIFATLPGIRPQVFNTVNTLCFLLRRKHCWTLLNVRGQTFFGVITLEQDLLVLALNRQRGFHWNLPSRLHGTLNASYGLRSFVWWRELACVFHDVLHEAIALENIVHNAKFLRLFERECIAGNHQFDGFALPYQAR